MAELEDNEVFADDQDPFGGNSKRVDVKTDKKINTSQLADEIEKRHKSPVSLIINNNRDGSRTLWVTPGDVDGRTINGALKSHEYDDKWGLSRDQIENREKIERLRNGEQLSLKELNGLIKELVAPE